MLSGCTGIPTSPTCDEPDHSCNRPLGNGATSLQSLRSADPAQRAPAGVTVDARSLQVIAFDGYDETSAGAVGTVYVQQVIAAGDTSNRFSPCPLLDDRSARVCGISTYRAVFAPLAYRPSVGDLVDLSGGVYEEFDCSGVCGTPAQPFPNGAFLPQVNGPTVKSAGVAPQGGPLHVTVADLAAHNQELIGTLVQVDDVTATAAPDRRGEIAISPAPNAVALTQEMMPITGVTAGTHWAHVIGVVSYFYTPKLIPRTPADLVR